MEEKTKENTTFVINENLRANSYEFGKAGNRHKVYYESAEDLKIKIKALIAEGLASEEDFKNEKVS